MPLSTESSFHCQEAARDEQKGRLWVGVWSSAQVSQRSAATTNLLVIDGLILELEVKTKRLVVMFSHLCLVLLSSLVW